MSSSNKKEPIIKTKKVIPILKEIYCPECGEKLNKLNYVISTYPPLYPYNCPDCNIDVILDKLYPRNINVEVAFDESTTMGEN